MTDKYLTPPVIFTAATASSYLVLYSGYDKGSGKLQPIRKLSAIFSMGNIRFSLNEINKVLGLTGLTVFSASFILQSSFFLKYLPNQFQPSLFSRNSLSSNSSIQELRMHALYILIAHGSYSFLTYIDRYSMGHPKQIAMAFGNCAMVTMSLIYYNKISAKYAVVSLGFALLHFYKMESKPHGQGLDIRPYGYFALAVGVLAFVNEVAVRCNLYK